jgi:tetratricopeptide (TPR) repeat protein/tRNA A-37 threonylcarbamoyl transferase component Bud32
MTPPDAGGGNESLREHLDRSLGQSYRIEHELSGGGMSRVFVAEERALGRRVVVKVLAPELAHELSGDRFAREIRLLARLQHPNIVPVLTAGDADGVSWYAMPFIEGESLRARLARLPDGERLPLPQALGVLRDVARALDYAHSHDVVHRDIKPDNVLLGYDAAVVADFGVAKAMAAARTHGAESTTLTRGGMALGTPAYMSPEQAAGDPMADHRADIYAWGILAYELFAGVHPFAGRRTVQALVTAHLTEHPRPLGEAAPLVPATLSALVTRCLAKDPAARPGSGRELVDALTAAASGDQPEPPDMARARPRAVAPEPDVSARTRRLALAAGIIVTLVGAGAGIAWMARGDPTSPGPPAASGARSTAPEAYLRGRVRVSSENRQDNDAAITALRQAITASPAFAPAHAELARALTIKSFYFAADTEKKQLDEDAEVAVQRALSLEPDLAEAHFARGLMLWTPARRFPHDQAVRAYQQAIALDPKLDEAHHQLGLVLLHVGLLDQGKGEIEQALAINPGNTLARFRLGVAALYQNQFEQAYAIFNSTPLERSPSLWAFQTATALFRLGREQEATELIDRFLRDYPRDEGGVGHSVRAMLLARSGQRRAAEAAIAEALELGRGFGHFHHTAYNIATAYALLGDVEPAIRWLESAADDGFPCYPLFASDTQLDRLRGDARFRTLMARLEREWEERKQSL